MVRQGILSTTSDLTSANKKISFKNLSLPSLSDMEKIDNTISIGLQNGTIDFLSFNIGLSSFEA